MSIGLYVERNFKSREEYITFMINFLPLILGTKEIPSDFISTQDQYFFNPKYYKKMEDYADNYIRIDGREIYNSDISELYNIIKKRKLI